VTARRQLTCLPAASILALAAGPVLAVDQVHDEIQVYNAEIAEVGQWTYQQHLNFTGIGQTVPEFPGGFTSLPSSNQSQVKSVSVSWEK
jgi:hypothetical protein